MAVVGLTILDRLQLLKALPAEGDFVTLRIVRRMRDALSFSEREIADYGIRNDGSTITWTTGGDEEKRIEFGAKARQIVRTALTGMNTMRTLTTEYLEVVQKFCPELCPPVEEDEVVKAEQLEQLTGLQQQQLQRLPEAIAERIVGSGACGSETGGAAADNGERAKA